MKGSRQSLAVVAVVAVASVGASACGSSSKSNTAAKPASTPAAPATPSTPSTANPTGQLPNTPASTPINSAAFKAGFIRTLESHGVPNSKATKAADCVVSKSEAQGIKTAGDVRTHPNQNEAILKECAPR